MSNEPSTPAAPIYSDHEKGLLLDLARRAVACFAQWRMLPEPTVDTPALLEPRAAFVTVRERHTDRLRGCRGCMQPRQPLYREVMVQAISAALDDPRFPPMHLDELPYLAFHINVLGPLEPISPEQVEIGRHGLLIKHPSGGGVLLPEVPVHFGLKTVDEFLKALCHKANLPADAWKDPECTLYGFQTQAWGEEAANSAR
jgi:AmmeMemoRadiSam system protein A